MRILVTGGAGYVGSVCVGELIQRGHEVLVLDDLSAGHRAAVPQSAVFMRGDFGDARLVDELFSHYKIEAVFHFAGRATIPESMTNPEEFFEVNVAGGLRMLQAMRRAGIRKIVFSSSAATYGEPQQTPITEDHPQVPVNSYGESKLIFEKMLKWYASAYGWSTIAFRYFNAAGSDEMRGEDHRPETHILPLLFQAASRRRPYFEIFGTDYSTPDGTCVRDFVHVSDIARAHILGLELLEKPGFRAYNIGSGSGYSVAEVCKAVEKTTGWPLTLREGPRRPGDPAVLVASPERLSKGLGWRAQFGLEKIIQSAWLWHRNFPDGYPAD
jgi:UDP-glucose 4-epimerase